MDRRAFVRTVASGLLASPFTTFAQQPARVPRVGILASEVGAHWEGLRQGMRDLGYVDGRNVTLDARWFEGRTERLPTLALELVQLNVRVIVAAGTQAIRAVKETTSTIPIVMALSAYPEKIGLVESLAHPGGNVTGLSNVSPDLMGKRLQLLREIAPKITRVAVLWNPASPVEPNGLRETVAAAPVAGVTVQSIEVQTADDYAAAFATLMGSRSDALFPFGNPVNFKNRDLIVDFASRNKLPGLYDERLFVASGGLLSYGPSYVDLWRRSATYVDKILKGAHPADLPVEQPTKFELFINEKTASALGLTIPQSIIDRGGEII